MTITELRAILRSNIAGHQRDITDPVTPRDIRVYLEGRRDAEYDLLKQIAEPARTEARR